MSTENVSATSGQLLEFVSQFARFLSLDASRSEVQKILDSKEDPFWTDLARRLKQSAIRVGKTLKEMIAEGKFDWVNGDVNSKNFGPETLVLGEGAKHFGFEELGFAGRDTITSEEVIAKLDELGYRKASLGDLLVYGAENPREQLKYPIVALGSVAGVGGRRSVACLSRGGSGRGLYLDWFDGGWSRICRFLAVRK